MAINVIEDKCKGCKLCIKACPFEAIEMVGKLAVINDKCTGCNAVSRSVHSMLLKRLPKRMAL